MHPDQRRLAAYLDGALDPAAQAELRAHVLTCPACAARLERLREDARRIVATLTASPAPADLRAAVRARMRRPAFGSWLAHGLALAGAVAALLLFAALLGAGRVATAMRQPDRLFVTDKAGGQLIVLDGADGARLATTKLGDQPSGIAYDAARERLYVLLKQSVVALDPSSLQPVDRWNAPRSLPSNAQIALDGRAARLYVVLAEQVVALDLDAPGLPMAASYDLGATASSLALAPDGASLLALDPHAGRLWRIGASGVTSELIAPSLAAPDSLRNGWLVASPADGSVYVLLTEAFDGHRPGIWRLDARGRVSLSAPLQALPPPWDFVLLGDGQLAIPRGNGSAGGVELIDTATLSTTARLDPDRDQHHLVAGPNRALFGLNFTHNTVTRYDASAGLAIWRTPDRGDYQPWDGVFVAGGWRWPWAR